MTVLTGEKSTKSVGFWFYALSLLLPESRQLKFSLIFETHLPGVIYEIFALKKRGKPIMAIFISPRL